MIYIGNHLSSTGRFAAMGRHALKLGANTFAFFQEFDELISLDCLKALHLNDSKNPMGAHKDRHEKLGEGHIGNTILENVITHPLLQDKPFILETPNEDEGYAKEIAWVKSVMK